jgi:hypothetical protein
MSIFGGPDWSRWSDEWSDEDPETKAEEPPARPPTTTNNHTGDKSFISSIVSAGSEAIDDAYNLIEMPGDNNCQFHAIAYLLKNNYPRGYAQDTTHKTVRRLLCDYVAKEMPIPVAAMTYIGRGHVRESDDIIEVIPNDQQDEQNEHQSLEVYARRFAGQAFETQENEYKPVSKCYEDGVWGNQQTLEAAAQRFQVLIAVVSQGHNERTGAEENRVTFIEPRPGTRPLATWVLNHTSAVHYDVLEPSVLNVL